MTAFMFIMLVLSSVFALMTLILLGIIVVQDYIHSKDEKDPELEVYDDDDLEIYDDDGGLE